MGEWFQQFVDVLPVGHMHGRGKIRREKCRAF